MHLGWFWRMFVSQWGLHCHAVRHLPTPAFCCCSAAACKASPPPARPQCFLVAQAALQPPSHRPPHPTPPHTALQHHSPGPTAAAAGLPCSGNSNGFLGAARRIPTTPLEASSLRQKSQRRCALASLGRTATPPFEKKAMGVFSFTKAPPPATRSLASDLSPEVSWPGRPGDAPRHAALRCTALCRTALPNLSL